jgi:hypothetical protein
MDNQKYDGADLRAAAEFRTAEADARAAGANPHHGACGGDSELTRQLIQQADALAGGTLTGGAAAVSAAYPNADPELVAKNTAEINDAVAKASQPKLVRHLIQQRIDEALHEAKRLQHLLDAAQPALLDCTVEDAHKIFG